MGPNLVVVPPLRLVLRAHLADQLLDFGSPQWILGHHRAGITGSIELLGRVVVHYLVGAVCTPPWRWLTVQPWGSNIEQIQDVSSALLLFTFSNSLSDFSLSLRMRVLCDYLRCPALKWQGCLSWSRGRSHTEGQRVFLCKTPGYRCSSLLVPLLESGKTQSWLIRRSASCCIASSYPGESLSRWYINKTSVLKLWFRSSSSSREHCPISADVLHSQI